MRKGPSIRLAPLADAVTRDEGDHDEVRDSILDATAALLAAEGLGGTTVEAVARSSGVGRTTVYRRFEGREDLVLAVIAREVRLGIAAIATAVEHLDRFEDRVVEGLIAGLRAARRSPLLPLVGREPDLLRLVTVDSGPLLRVAVDVLVAEHERRSGAAPTITDRQTAELLVRTAVSLTLVPDTELPLDDDAEARRALHALLDPLLR